MRTIENLAFKGGGVLGIAYAGAIEILEEHNLLDPIKRTAGTSAGSILATLVSMRYSAAEIKKLVNDTNFKNFEDGWDPLRIMGKYGLYKGDFFLSWIKGLIKDKTGNENLTFGELAGKGCRELHVFATDLNTNNLQVFSPRDTPTTIVAEAVRASMSIPLFFEAWKFSNGIPNDHLYVDGGLIYNFPITSFKDMSNTLGFFLTNDKNETNPLEYHEILKYIGQVVKTMLKSQGVNLNENQREMENTVMIDDFGISPINFKIDQAQKDKLYNSGMASMKAYLTKHMPNVT